MEREPNRPDGPVTELDHLVVRGASEHILKNVELALPKKNRIVFTGVSGSGKSSLAFDTIFAEGQRRYVSHPHMLGSSSARWRSPATTVFGVSHRRSGRAEDRGRNPRSTVGTITRSTISASCTLASASSDATNATALSSLSLLNRLLMR